MGNERVMKALTFVIQGVSWNSIYCGSIVAMVLGVFLFSCGCSTEENDIRQSPHPTSQASSISATTVDFKGYPFGPGWVFELAENDRKWATHLVDRAITACATGQVESELRYLRKIMEALNVVQIEGSFTDYREPLFLKTNDGTALAQRLERAGVDTMPARHTPWNYKDGFVQGLINILEVVDGENEITKEASQIIE